MDALREVVNIAMGTAGSQLGRLLSTFIQLPVPQLHHCRYEHLPHLLQVSTGELQVPAQVDGHAAPVIMTSPDNQLSAVSHGFKGNGITGEGVVLMRSRDIGRLDALMSQDLPDSNARTRILTDLSELLLGACLKGLADQLDVEFHHSYPVLLGHEKCCMELLRCQGSSQTVLAIEIRYGLLSPDIDCYLLLLITEDSLDALKSRADLLTD